MSKIKIGLPSKGRLKDESLTFLKSKKLEVVNSFGDRNYFFNIKNKNERSEEHTSELQSH